jgi:hypothetical protein
MVYQLDGIKYLYSFEKDSILDGGFSAYFVDPLFNRVVVKKADYLGCYTHPYYGAKYIKIKIPTFKELVIEERGGDAFLGYILTTDGKEYFYCFDNAKALDSMTVSPALRKLIPNGTPYLTKTFDKLKTGELCFVSDTYSKLLVQSSDGKKVDEVNLEYAAQKDRVTVIASNDFWYVNPISYFTPDTSFVEMYYRSKYDKIIPLEYSAFLGISGKEKWLVKYDEVNSKYKSPERIYFKGEKFIDTGGGFVVDISATSKPDFRFIKYHSRIFRLCCNPKTGKWESVSLTYLPVLGFEADSILLYADQTNEEAIVYKKNGKVFAFDIDDEQIYEMKDGKYFVSPTNRRIVFQSNESLITSFDKSGIYHLPGMTNYKLKSIRNLLLATVEFEKGNKRTMILNHEYRCK